MTSRLEWQVDSFGLMAKSQAGDAVSGTATLATLRPGTRSEGRRVDHQDAIYGNSNRLSMVHRQMVASRDGASAQGAPERGGAARHCLPPPVVGSPVAMRLTQAVNDRCPRARVRDHGHGHAAMRWMNRAHGQ